MRGSVVVPLAEVIGGVRVLIAGPPCYEPSIAVVAVTCWPSLSTRVVGRGFKRATDVSWTLGERARIRLAKTARRGEQARVDVSDWLSPISLHYVK